MQSRDQEILALRKQGNTLQKIGDIHGITRERVRQIIKKQDPELLNREAKLESLRAAIQALKTEGLTSGEIAARLEMPLPEVNSVW